MTDHSLSPVTFHVRGAEPADSGGPDFVGGGADASQAEDDANDVFLDPLAKHHIKLLPMNPALGCTCEAPDWHSIINVNANPCSNCHDRIGAGRIDDWWHCNSCNTMYCGPCHRTEKPQRKLMRPDAAETTCWDNTCRFGAPPGESCNYGGFSRVNPSTIIDDTLIGIGNYYHRCVASCAERDAQCWPPPVYTNILSLILNITDVALDWCIFWFWYDNAEWDMVKVQVIVIMGAGVVTVLAFICSGYPWSWWNIFYLIGIGHVVETFRGTLEVCNKYEGYHDWTDKEEVGMFDRRVWPRSHRVAEATWFERFLRTGPLLAFYLYVYCVDSAGSPIAKHIDDLDHQDRLMVITVAFRGVLLAFSLGWMTAFDIPFWKYNEPAYEGSCLSCFPSSHASRALFTGAVLFADLGARVLPVVIWLVATQGHQITVPFLDETYTTQEDMVIAILCMIYAGEIILCFVHGDWKYWFIPFIAGVQVFSGVFVLTERQNLKRAMQVGRCANNHPMQLVKAGIPRMCDDQHAPYCNAREGLIPRDFPYYECFLPEELCDHKIKCIECDQWEGNKQNIACRKFRSFMTSGLRYFAMFCVLFEYRYLFAGNMVDSAAGNYWFWCAITCIVLAGVGMSHLPEQIYPIGDMICPSREEKEGCCVPSPSMAMRKAESDPCSNIQCCNPLSNEEREARREMMRYNSGRGKQVWGTDDTAHTSAAIDDADL